MTLNKDRKNQKGFVLLMVILLISVILIIGLGVFDIIVREILISSLGRESLKAFYTSDSAADCVRYWHKQVPSAFIPGSPFTIQCNGIDISGAMTSGTPSISQNDIEVNFDSGSCALVRIRINIPPANRTIIESRGYNIGCAEESARKVERGVRITY